MPYMEMEVMVMHDHPCQLGGSLRILFGHSSHPYSNSGGQVAVCSLEKTHLVGDSLWGSSSLRSTAFLSANLACYIIVTTN